MIILCMDGLDPTQASEYGLHLPYEGSLKIPRELYHGAYPHTLHIWPSMFTGKCVRHPDLQTQNSLRVSIRGWLHKNNISWNRKGVNIHQRGWQPDDVKGKVYNKSANYEDTIFSEYNSFIYNIPGLVDGFVLGGTKEWAKSEHRLFNILANTVPQLGYEIVAVYTHNPDYEDHRGINYEPTYRQGFLLAELLAKRYDTILLSDHGCVNGFHTDSAYIGASFPFEADSVLDVRKVIEEKM
jgi:hypothetical protein